MNVIQAVEVIKLKFAEAGSPAEVPLLKGGGSFAAELTEGGIRVSNLRNEPFLPWVVFQEAVCVLIHDCQGDGSVDNNWNVMGTVLLTTIGSRS